MDDDSAGSAYREEEHFFTCPHCWQRVSVLLDLSIGTQEFVEDCEVCCRPLHIRYAAEDGMVQSFGATSAEER